MSFSSNVKSELAHHFGEARHCQISEIAALLNMCGDYVPLAQNFCVKIHTENVTVARKCFTLLKKTFNIECEIQVRRNQQLNKKRAYTLLLDGAEDAVQKALLATGLMTKEKQVALGAQIDPLVVSSVCCKRAYIRGAFLAAGSVSDPEKTYHLEFVANQQSYAQQLIALINSFDMDAKMVKRKEQFVVYLKEGEQIVDLLNIMGAHVALMEMENVRIIKDMRNNVNRKVNCETANLNKTIAASVKQLEDIQLLQQTVGFDTLPKALEEIAQARMAFPEASLKELGEMMDPPVGKSGVNHRLRKISEMAENLREGMVRSDDQ